MNQFPLRPVLVLALAAAALVAFGQQSLYVSTSGQSGYQILAISPAGSVSTFDNGHGLSGPTGLAFDAANNLYVANFNGRNIERFTAGGVSTGAVFASTGTYSPYDMAINGAGDLYTADISQNAIERFSPAGVGTVFAHGGSLDSPRGVAVDAAGNLYVANAGTRTGEGSIERFNPSGLGTVFASGVGVSNPYDIAFDAAGNVYVANGYSGTIERFTPGGVGSVFASGLLEPIGLAFDTTGNLYVAEANGNDIKRFTPSGVGSVFADLRVDTPFRLAFGPAPLHPVPEPSALAALGVGAIALLRRKRAQGHRNRTR